LSRQNSRYRGLLRDARLKVAQACVEDVSYKGGRGLDKSQIAALADGAWIERGQNLNDGTDRVGKNLDRVCARPSGVPARLCPILARAAAVRGNPHLARRWQLSETAQAPRQDAVLILDDWGLIALSTQDRADLLEILDDRLNALHRYL
jgi:hypothetical protein